MDKNTIPSIRTDSAIVTRSLRSKLHKALTRINQLEKELEKTNEEKRVAIDIRNAQLKLVREKLDKARRDVDGKDALVLELQKRLAKEI